MNIDYPTQDQIPGLRALWQEAFGDSEAFLDVFFTHGFAADRCRCITRDGRPVAMLYWFDCSLEGKPVAYLYAVATAKDCRGQGLCRALVENTHNHLKYLGYSGEILVPGETDLFRMYEKMGYTLCSEINEFSCTAEAPAVTMRPLDKEEYSQLRREYLPAGGVRQEGDALEFLSTMADFYAGEDFLLAVSRSTEEFLVLELLGNAQAAPGILSALGQSHGKFRTPSNGRPFGMYHPLSSEKPPCYFAFAFD